MLPFRLRLAAGRTQIRGGTPQGPRRNPVLIRALRRAHAMLHHDRAGLPLLEAAPRSMAERRLIVLALLAPDLQRDILAGNQPPGMTLAALIKAKIPLLWAEQRALFDRLA